MEDEVYKTALILVNLFELNSKREKNGLKSTGRHSRIFQYVLHPEIYFVGYGKTKETLNASLIHPEHVVPCAILISECNRLLENGMAKEEIAKLLTKHWKIVYITKEQAALLDTKKGICLKHSMPSGWCFETGDTFARLKLANIIKHEDDLLSLD